MSNGTEGRPTRRAKGEGTIWQEADGTWSGQIDLGRDGRGRRLRPKRRGRTKSGVAKKLREVARAHEQGLTATGRGRTVAKLAEDWYAKAAMGTQEASTLAHTRVVLDAHIIPALGALRVEEVTTDHVEDWLAAENAQGRAHATLVKYRQVLRQLFRWAMARKYVTWSPAQYAELPEATNAPAVRRSLTRAEADRLLAALAEDRHGPYFVTMLLLGLRPGEVDGLRWDAIAGDVVTIDRAMKRAHGVPVGVASTKTRNVRALRIPAVVADALRRQRAIQAADRLAAGAGYATEWDGHVFLNELGRPYGPSNVRRAFAKACQRAGLPRFVPYELRHSAASLLVAAGVPREDVIDLMGWVDGRMLDRHYRHPVVPVVAAAADFWSAPPVPAEA